MAVKREVYELCQACGQPDARSNGDGTVTWGLHRCPNRPPGPPESPHTMRESDVIYVDADEADYRDAVAALEAAWPKSRAELDAHLLRFRAAPAPRE